MASGQTAACSPTSPTPSTATSPTSVEERGYGLPVLIRLAHQRVGDAIYIPCRRPIRRCCCINSELSETHGLTREETRCLANNWTSSLNVISSKTSCTRPIVTAWSASTDFPAIAIHRAQCGPTSFVKRLIPPDPGGRPSWRSRAAHSAYVALQTGNRTRRRAQHQTPGMALGQRGSLASRLPRTHRRVDAAVGGFA